MQWSSSRAAAAAAPLQSGEMAACHLGRELLAVTLRGYLAAKLAADCHGGPTGAPGDSPAGRPPQWGQTKHWRGTETLGELTKPLTWWAGRAPAQQIKGRMQMGSRVASARNDLGAVR